MTKTILLSTIFIMAFATTCLSQQKLATTASGANPLTFSIDGKTITALLDANPTTGYKWNYKIEKEKIVKYISDEYTTPQDDQPMMGRGGKHKFVFEGKKSGTTTIVFDYSRNNGESNGTRTLKVTVKKKSVEVEETPKPTETEEPAKDSPTVKFKPLENQ